MCVYIYFNTVEHTCPKGHYGKKEDHLPSSPLYDKTGEGVENYGVDKCLTIESSSEQHRLSRICLYSGSLTWCLHI